MGSAVRLPILIVVAPVSIIVVVPTVAAILVSLPSPHFVLVAMLAGVTIIISIVGELHVLTGSVVVARMGTRETSGCQNRKSRHDNRSHAPLSFGFYTVKRKTLMHVLHC